MNPREQDQALTVQEMYENAKCEVAALREELRELKSEQFKERSETNKYRTSFRTLVAEITRGMK